MERQKRFLLHAAVLAVSAGAIYLTVHYFLPWLLPFLIALILAAALNPAVEACRQKLHFRRNFTSAVLLLLLLTVLVFLGRALAGQLAEQLRQLLQELPGQLARLPDSVASVYRRVESFCKACPEPVGRWAQRLPQVLSGQLGDLLRRFSSGLLAYLSNAVTRLPQFILSCATTVLAAFFTLNSYPSILNFFRRQLSPASLTFLRGVHSGLLITILRYLRSQLILITVTFTELLLGFLFLRQRYALLLAALISLIDALPVFGTGTVLLPWAVLCFLTQQLPRGLALVILYVLITLVRNLLEPKIMASQAGLPPIAALAAMYVGFRTLGIAGMILFPVALLLLKQLHDTGYLRTRK